MQTNNHIVDHLFRHQYGRMVAILIKLFGFGQIEIAEDIVQDSFVKAMNAWKISGPPENPEGWLMQTAKNQAIDYFRREKVKSKVFENVQATGVGVISLDNLFLEKEISDAQLQMIFACCHQALKKQDQIALTLQVVSGFSLSEIANALLLKKEQVKKRIQRAKAKLKSLSLDLKIPSGPELIQRLPTVESVLYLIFNEGYYSNSTETIIRDELCFEAMRLTRLVVEHPLLNQSSSYALLGLMCFHAARNESRISANHELILLKDQDRSQWNDELIFLANHYMYKAVEEGTFSIYHYQAAIAAEYMKVPNFEATDWSNILRFYNGLLELEQSPTYLLNKSVVLIYLEKYKEAEQNLKNIEAQLFESKSYLLHSIWATLEEKKGQGQRAVDHLLMALKAAPSKAEKTLINIRLNSLR